MHLREDQLRKMTKTVTNIEDSRLLEFCTWYAQRHGVKPVPFSVFTTCICGYFHTFSKTAGTIVARCQDAGLISVKHKVVTFI